MKINGEHKGCPPLERVVPILSGPLVDQPGRTLRNIRWQELSIRSSRGSATPGEARVGALGRCCVPERGSRAGAVALGRRKRAVFRGNIALAFAAGASLQQGAGGAWTRALSPHLKIKTVFCERRTIPPPMVT